MFADTRWVITGTLSLTAARRSPRLILEKGGKVSGSLSNKTSYLLAGAEAGSKLEKARIAGRQESWTRRSFSRMLGGGGTEVEEKSAASDGVVEQGTLVLPLDEQT